MYQLPQWTPGLPYLEGNPLRSGPLGCQPVPSLALPLSAKTHMPAGLAVVPAFGDGIEGLLAAHAHGDFLFSDGCRCPLPKIHILERGPGPRSETATPQPSPASPCPLPQGLDHHWEAADTFRRPAFESLLCPSLTVLLKTSHFYFLGLGFSNDFSVAIPTEDYASKVMHCLSGLYSLRRGEDHFKIKWEHGGLEGVSVQERGGDSYWRVRGCVFIFPVC